MRICQVSIGLAGAVLLAAGCVARDAKPRLGEVDRPPRMETVEPTLHTVWPVQIELAATVEPLETAPLCARVPGVVDYLPADVDIGRRVRAGEILIRLAVPDLEAEKRSKDALLEQARNQKLQAHEAEQVAARELEEAQKQEQRYRSDYDFRKLEHQRIAQLARSEAVPPQRAEETRNQLEGAESAWQAARAQVETKRARLRAAGADLEVAESKIRVAEADAHRLAVLVGLATITAPFNGVITKRWVDRGVTIKDPGVPLVTVMNTDTVRVVLDIPERDVPLVNASEQNPNPDGSGDRVELTVPALAEVMGGKPFLGAITRLASVLDPATRTMRAEVHLSNKDGYLRPGMYGVARVLLETRENVLTVPSTALLRRGSQVELFYVDPLPNDPSRGIARRVAVEIGLDDGVRVQVRGLKGKERIIAKGNGMIHEGDPVIAVPVSSP